MVKKSYIVILVILIVSLVALYLYFFPISKELEIPEGRKEIKVFSKAFSDMGNIPLIYTKDGEDIPPSISWVLPSNVKNVACYALIMYDPDAPNPPFVHWLLFNMPSNIDNLPENVPKELKVSGIGLQGKNDYGEIGYGGPYPPKGSTHRYIVRVYALDSCLTLNPGVDKVELIKAIKDHVIVYGEIVGIYSR